MSGEETIACNINYCSELKKDFDRGIPILNSVCADNDYGKWSTLEGTIQNLSFNQEGEPTFKPCVPSGDLVPCNACVKQTDEYSVYASLKNNFSWISYKEQNAYVDSPFLQDLRGGLWQTCNVAVTQGPENDQPDLGKTACSGILPCLDGGLCNQNCRAGFDPRICSSDGNCKDGQFCNVGDKVGDGGGVFFSYSEAFDPPNKVPAKSSSDVGYRYNTLDELPGIYTNTDPMTGKTGAISLNDNVLN